MLLGAKIFAPAIAIILVLGFSTGLLHYNRDKARCLVPRGYEEGGWHTFFAIGRLEFRVHDYTCDPNFRLDPSKWSNDGTGTLTPKFDR